MYDSTRLPRATWLSLGTGLLCALLSACGDCTDGPCDATDYSYSYPSARESCYGLSESACESSSHCIVDSVCAPSSRCSGSGCSETCDLVRVCAPSG